MQTLCSVTQNRINRVPCPRTAVRQTSKENCDALDFGEVQYRFSLYHVTYNTNSAYKLVVEGTREYATHEGNRSSPDRFGVFRAEDKQKALRFNMVTAEKRSFQSIEIVPKSGMVSEQSAREKSVKKRFQNHEP